MNEVLRDALVAARSGNQEKARVMLAEYLRGDPDNVPAWVLLSKLATSPVQKAAFLRKILDIDPDHAYARQALQEIGQAPAPVVNAVDQPDVAEPAPGESDFEELATQQAGPERDFEDDYAEIQETVEPREDQWPVSEDSAGDELQAAGDAIPSWISSDETMIEGRMDEDAVRADVTDTAHDAVQEDEEELPQWLREDEVGPAPEAEATTDAEDAAAAEKAARISAAMSQEAPAVVEAETESERSRLLPLLIVVAVVVFLLLVYAVLTYLV